jgi:hypothetical protein
MGVNHGRADIFMPEQFLDSANVVAGLKQMRGKGMSVWDCATRIVSSDKLIMKRINAKNKSEIYDVRMVGAVPKFFPRKNGSPYSAEDLMSPLQTGQERF